LLYGKSDFMNAENIKLNLIEWLLKQDINMLKKIDLIRKKQEEGFSALTEEELEKRALIAEEDIKAGRLTSIEKLSEELKAW
jgi:hypothetical protein